MAKALTEVATVNQTMNYELSKPATLIHLATDLKKFIIEQKLSSNIQGKEYANVEAWQFAGLSLGIIPITTKVENLSVENLSTNSVEIKYRAEVELYLNDKKVGSGVALCSNKEPSKKFYAEYAICSMAQTRAVGKAYRLMLGFLMKAAGFEATPSEELQDAVIVNEPAKAAPKPVSSAKSAPLTSLPEGLQALLETIAGIDTIYALTQFYFKFSKDWETNETFTKAITQAKERIAAIEPVLDKGQVSKVLLKVNHSVITTEEKAEVAAKVSTMKVSQFEPTLAKWQKIIDERTKSAA